MEVMVKMHWGKLILNKGRALAPCSRAGGPIGGSVINAHATPMSRFFPLISALVTHNCKGELQERAVLRCCDLHAIQIWRKEPPVTPLGSDDQTATRSRAKQQNKHERQRRKCLTRCIKARGALDPAR